MNGGPDERACAEGPPFHGSAVPERRPGIEPGSPAWHAGILPLNDRRSWSGQPDSNRHRKAWKACMRPSQRTRIERIANNSGPVGNRTPISTVQTWHLPVGRPALVAVSIETSLWDAMIRVYRYTCQVRSQSIETCEFPMRQGVKESNPLARVLEARSPPWRTPYAWISRC